MGPGIHSGAPGLRAREAHCQIQGRGLVGKVYRFGVRILFMLLCDFYSDETAGVRSKNCGFLSRKTLRSAKFKMGHISDLSLQKHCELEFWILSGNTFPVFCFHLSGNEKDATRTQNYQTSQKLSQLACPHSVVSLWMRCSFNKYVSTSSQYYCRESAGTQFES